jgi:hypothetical protein
VIANATSWIRRHRGRVIRLLLTALAAVLLLGLLAPLVQVPFLSSRIQAALEETLGRKVRIGAVHLTLFAGPGFSLDDVSIEEDPRFGLEPFAFVETLEARVRPDKLFFGRLQIASLRFVHPSLNLVKQADGTWNVVALLDRISAPRRAPLNMVPALVLSGARLDFKLGLRKTTFYVADTDLDLYPQRSGSITVRFAGSPARTDRTGHGFGHFRGEFTWPLAAQSAGPRLRADLILDPSNLSELTTLLEGYDIGIHGTVSTSAHIEGPSSNLAVTGELRMEDVHRWDLLPVKGEDWRIRYRGSVDLLAHRFDLETIPAQENQPVPVALRLRVNDFLGQTNWGFLATLDRIPAGLLPLVRRLGLSPPEGISLDGSMQGVIGYSSRLGFSGQIGFTDVTTTLPGVVPLHAAEATATIERSRIRLEPTQLELGDSATVEASADYDPSSRNLDVLLSATETPIEPLATALSSWFASVPGLSDFLSGEATGLIRYTLSPPDPPDWSGQLKIAAASLQPSGISAPLTDVAAHLELDAGGLNLTGISATLGDMHLSGDYRYIVKGPHHEHLRAEIESGGLDQIETLFEPSLRSGTLLARFRIGRRSLPAWMTARDLEGDVAVGKFSAAGVALGPLKTHILWEAGSVQLTSITLGLDQGRARGKGSINLTGNLPRYRLTGNIDGLPWKGGHLSLSGNLDTSGTGRDALRNLRSNGNFTGAGWRLAAGADFSEVKGKFQLSLAQGWPNLRLSALKAFQGEDVWDGAAASEPDGKLVFDFVNGRRQWHVVSTVAPQPADSSSAAAGAGSLASSR